MIRVRKAAERGHFDHGWLDTYHTFSFGDYYDAAHLGFRSLRVINDDRVQPGQGFGMHGHRDMEIVTYVLDGALAHQDSMGNGSILRAGGLQRMTAGTGVRHSEFNPSDTERVHLYQIWLLPQRKGLEPGYEELALGEDDKRGRFRLVASPDGRLVLAHRREGLHGFPGLRTAIGSALKSLAASGLDRKLEALVAAAAME